jgi:hypothetical protein
MTEPPNHTALHDDAAYTWVRVDEHPGPHGTWHALTNDPGWDENARRLGPLIWDWDSVKRRPLFAVSDAEAERAVQRVRALMAS